jgi:hypothetical protein
MKELYLYNSFINIYIINKLHPYFIYTTLLIFDYFSFSRHAVAIQFIVIFIFIFILYIVLPLAGAGKRKVVKIRGVV